MSNTIDKINKVVVEFETHIGKLDHLNMKYLEIPTHIIDQLGGKLKLRLICTVNKSLTFQCGLMALGEGKAYISINAKRIKELNVSIGDRVHIKLEKDTSKYGMPMPKELEELLAQDDEGKRRFIKLPISTQRYIMYYIAQVKRSYTRIDRAITLIENLKQLPEGKEDFKYILGKH